jgi:hypothetical protein
MVAVADLGGDPFAGPSVEFRSLAPVVRRFFGEVTYVAIDRLVRRVGFFETNRTLLRECTAAPTRLVFVVPFENQVEWPILQSIRGTDRPVVAWMRDDGCRLDRFSRHIADCFDLVATANAAAFREYQRIPGVSPLLTHCDDDRFHHLLQAVGVAAARRGTEGDLCVIE